MQLDPLDSNCLAAGPLDLPINLYRMDLRGVSSQSRQSETLQFRDHFSTPLLEAPFVAGRLRYYRAKSCLFTICWGITLEVLKMFNVFFFKGHDWCCNVLATIWKLIDGSNGRCSGLPFPPQNNQNVASHYKSPSGRAGKSSKEIDAAATVSLTWHFDPPLVVPNANCGCDEGNCRSSL